MSILTEIIKHKQAEVETQKGVRPIRLLEQSEFFEREVFSFSGALKQATNPGIIAEFKRKSPSKGWINEGASVMEVAKGYAAGGAAAMSVLTDEHYFGGGNQYLTIARRSCQLPILRKDFIVDEYQVIEAKSIGADAILLIAAALPKHRLEALGKLAQSIGLEVLMEVHEMSELAKLHPYLNVIGINNRNLSTFEVNIDASLQVAQQIPADMCRISESGLGDAATIVKLIQAAFDGFLIGESFMKTAMPGKACESLVTAITNQQKLVKS